MDGFTDALVLVAPVRWWPSLGELSQHPLHSTRSFCAAVTDGGAAHECAPSDASHPAGALTQGSHGLSRLGTSTFLTASWHDADDDAGADECINSSVQVRNPITGQLLVLRVAQYPPEEDKSSLFALAKTGRIRLRPRRLCDDTGSGAGPAKRQGHPNHASSTRDDQNADGGAVCVKAFAEIKGPEGPSTWFRMLTMRAREELLTTSHAFLQSLRPGSSRVHTALLSGVPGSGKRTLLEDLCRSSIPLTVPTAHTTFITEHRCLNFRDLLALDDREVTQAIATTLQPIPHANGGSAVAALVVVRLYHVDLLWGSAHDNALLDVAACQLCDSLDALASTAEGNPTAFLVWSTADQPTVLAPPLRQRLAACHITLASPTTRERTEYFQYRLHAQRGEQGGTAVSLPPIHPSPTLLEGLTDASANMSAWQLSRQPIAALLAKAEAVSAGKALAAGKDAYAHLFNVEAQVAALEELVVWPVTHLRLLRAYNVPCAKGVLVCGPSGSGKTALLSALARRLRDGHDSKGIHVVMVDGLSLIEKEVGQSEKNIASLFAAARAQAPTALFLDNLDALAPPRGRETAETTTATDRTLSTLLTEMDGVAGDPNRVVVVVASAPSPECLDAAVRRPGRLDVHLSLTPPELPTREAVVRGRLRHFAAHLLALHHVPHTGTREDALDELDESLFKSFAAEAAKDVSTSAETVALVREVMLLVLAEFAHALGEGQQQTPTPSVDWPAFKTLVKKGLTSATTNPDPNSQSC